MQFWHPEHAIITSSFHSSPFILNLFSAHFLWGSHIQIWTGSKYFLTSHSRALINTLLLWFALSLPIISKKRLQCSQFSSQRVHFVQNNRTDEKYFFPTPMFLFQGLIKAFKSRIWQSQSSLSIFPFVLCSFLDNSWNSLCSFWTTTNCWTRFFFLTY